ncbi:peptide chain release factor N(5)-glutamine methyltransferase [Pseudoxanthobacter sp.]|uniref:peptide chain release factor N(5)-glutamine methyltransferase n=1 Tax=Pseudoxanthobacter sp. TaxID=1925742 RepID=UPI002FE18BD4
MSAPAAGSAGALLHVIRTRFRAAGLETADLDARLLVAEALGIAPQRLIIDGTQAVSPQQAAVAEGFAARRLAGEPVGRIRGRRAFWGHEFRLTPDMLEPRPDTETVVEAALEAFPHRDRPFVMADLGTGSGAILVAVLSERPAACGFGLDLAAGVPAGARANAEAAGVAGRALFLQGDFASPPFSGLDLVVSNPPYIPAAGIAGLAPEVRLHDPLRALAGGADGLDCYRALLPAAFAALKPGGWLIVEIGLGQEGDVGALAAAAGFAGPATRPDLSGRVRVVTARRP